MFTIGVSAGVDVDELKGLLEIFESKGRAGAFPFKLEWCLMGVAGSCSDGGGTRSDNSPVNIPLSELPHPFEVLSNSFNRGGIGLCCAKARLMSTSLTLILRRLTCFDEEATSLNSFAIGVVIGDPSFPGMFTTTIELLSDSWLSLKASASGRMPGRGFEKLGPGSEGIPTSQTRLRRRVGNLCWVTGGRAGGRYLKRRRTLTKWVSGENH
jgi:hypothetical protein